jgi:PHD and RING finger domain-containing protein 1
VGPDGLGYESQPEGHDVEHAGCDERQAGTGHTSAECLSHEGSRDSDENVLETGKESEEVSTASGGVCTPKDGGTDTTSSEAASESPTCPICFAEFITQIVGTTDTCDHSYCLTCILQWSEHANTCQIDRETFNFIVVRHHLNGEIVSNIHVEPPAPQPEDEDGVLQNVIYCQVCDECDRQDRMLLCIFCEAAYHVECLDPPLDRVPLGQWFCPHCFWLLSIFLTQGDHDYGEEEVNTYSDGCAMHWETPSKTVGDKPE